MSVKVLPLTGTINTLLMEDNKFEDLLMKFRPGMALTGISLTLRQFNILAKITAQEWEKSFSLIEKENLKFYYLTLLLKLSREDYDKAPKTLDEFSSAHR